MINFAFFISGLSRKLNRKPIFKKKNFMEYLIPTPCRMSESLPGESFLMTKILSDKVAIEIDDLKYGIFLERKDHLSRWAVCEYRLLKCTRYSSFITGFLHVVIRMNAFLARKIAKEKFLFLDFWCCNQSSVHSCISQLWFIVTCSTVEVIYRMAYTIFNNCYHWYSLSTKVLFIFYNFLMHSCKEHHCICNRLQCKTG